MIRLPSIRPAVVAGVGAGGSLAAAGVCILALGAASVGLVSWPEEPQNAESAKVGLALPAAPRPKAQPPVLTAALPARRPRPSRAARPATPASAPVRPPATRSRPPAPAGERPPASAPGASPAPQPAPPAPPPGDAPDPQPTLVRDRVQELNRVASEQGEEVAKVVGGVNPTAGQLAHDAVDLVSTTVDGVAGLLP